MNRTDPADSVRAHRSYRRLDFPHGRHNALTFLCVVAVEVLLWSSFPSIDRFASAVAITLLGRTVGDISLDTTHYGPVTVYPIVFSTPALGYRTLVVWIIACVVLMVLTGLSKKLVAAPARFIATYNLFIVLVSALYLLFNGTMGYSAQAFSSLYVTTCAFVWALMPVITWVYGFFLGPGPMAFLMAASLLYEFCFSVARYSLIVLLLHLFGVVLMPVLYLSFGPLLDFVLYVGIFSLLLPRMAHQTDAGHSWR